MKIRHNGAEAETEARTVAEYLSARGVDASRAVVEFRGEVYAPGADLSALELAEGDALDVFRITAGG